MTADAIPRRFRDQAADGTPTDTWEDNLLAETSIRHGGFGGIAYHYIALFSQFVPCGAWEAIYSIDGPLANASDVEPDTIHADTQGQSFPVFTLAHLFGLDLRPRLRNWKDLILFRHSARGRIPTPAIRKLGSMWAELPRHAAAGTEVGRARADRVRPRLHAPPVPGYPARLAQGRGRHPDLPGDDVHPATSRPELDKVVGPARELQSSGVAGTLVAHEQAALRHGIELAAQSGMEREYIRGSTLEGHGSARTRGKAIGVATVTDDAMLSMALHLRTQQLSLRGIAARLVITKGRKKGQRPSPATVLRMLRERAEKTAAA